MIFIILLRNFLFICLPGDDTNLLCIDKDLKSLESLINIELQKVCDWLNASKLSINAKRSHLLSLDLSYQINTRICNNTSNSVTSLECKEDVKFLGLLIDKNLTRKYHIDNIASEISRVVGIIAHLRYTVPLNILTKICPSLIFPYTHYGIGAWGQVAQVYLKNIFM